MLCISRALGSQLLPKLRVKTVVCPAACMYSVVASTGNAVRQAFCYCCLLAQNSQQFEGFGIEKLIEEVEE